MRQNYYNGNDSNDNNDKRNDVDINDDDVDDEYDGDDDSNENNTDNNNNNTLQAQEIGLNHVPLTRYVKLRVAHAPGIPGTFSPPLTSKETAS